MTYHYSATGERIEDEPEPTAIEPPAIVDEIHARCQELRQILSEARQRRQVAA